MTSSKKRSIIKAVTYRMLSSLVTCLMIYFFFRDASLSISVGFVDLLLKIVIYYLHERIWIKMDAAAKRNLNDIT